MAYGMISFRFCQNPTFLSGKWRSLLGKGRSIAHTSFKLGKFNVFMHDSVENHLRTHARHTMHIKDHKGT